MKRLKFLLDTSVYSQRLKPRPLAAVVRRWRPADEAAMAVSVIAEAELLFGLEKRASARMWITYREFIEGRLEVLPVDRPVVETYARIRAEQERSAAPRAQFDLLIAATALANSLALATLNVRHFEGIRGLEVEDWSR